MNCENVSYLVRKALSDEKFYALLMSASDAPCREKLNETASKEGIVKLSDEDIGDALAVLSICDELEMDQLKADRERNRQIAKKLSDELLLVIKQIRDGFGRVMNMYTIAFYMGVALIFTGVMASLVFRDNLVGLIFGGLGFADTVTIMVYKPADELQKSRGNLAQLQAALFTWINDMSNWNVFLERLDNSFKNCKPSFEEVKQVSKINLENLESILNLIQEKVE